METVFDNTILRVYRPYGGQLELQKRAECPPGSLANTYSIEHNVYSLCEQINSHLQVICNPFPSLPILSKCTVPISAVYQLRCQSKYFDHIFGQSQCSLSFSSQHFWPIIMLFIFSPTRILSSWVWPIPVCSVFEREWSYFGEAATDGSSTLHTVDSRRNTTIETNLFKQTWYLPFRFYTLMVSDYPPPHKCENIGLKEVIWWHFSVTLCCGYHRRASQA